ncbi:MAG: hypothetical protein ACR2QC_11365 [Gammaproteobacteria bacterium]
MPPKCTIFRKFSAFPAGIGRESDIMPPDRHFARFPAESARIFVLFSRPIPAKAGISAPKAQTVAEGVQLPAVLRRRRFLLSQEWDCGGGRIFGANPPVFAVAAQSTPTPPFRRKPESPFAARRIRRLRFAQKRFRLSPEWRFFFENLL